MIFREYSVEELIPSPKIDSMSIGYDERVYIIAEEKAYAVCVDWENGCEVEKVEEIGSFPAFRRIFWLTTIKDRYLVLGIPADIEPIDGDAYIVSKDKREVKQIYIGLWSMKNIYITDDGKIVIGYYDEAIFGNGHDEPHLEGVAVRDMDGRLLYRNTECSLAGVECVNGDDCGNIALIDITEKLYTFTPELKAVYQLPVIHETEKLIPVCGGGVEIVEKNPDYRCFAVRGTKLVYWNDTEGIGKIRFEYREIPQYNY